MRELRRNIHDSIFGSEPTEDLLTEAFDRKKNYSQQIIKKLAYTGNQILINNEKEINKYC